MAAIGVPFLRRPKRTLRDALSQVEDPALGLEVPEALAYGRGVQRQPGPAFAPEVASEPQIDPNTPTPAEIANLFREDAEPLPAESPTAVRTRQELEEMDKDRGFAGNVFGGKPRGLKQWLARIGILAAPVVAGGLLGGQEGLTGAMQGTAEALSGERERETAHRSKLRDIMLEEEARRERLGVMRFGQKEGERRHRETLAESIRRSKEAEADRDLLRQQNRGLAEERVGQQKTLAEILETGRAETRAETERGHRATERLTGELRDIQRKRPEGGAGLTRAQKVQIESRKAKELRAAEAAYTKGEIDQAELQTRKQQIQNDYEAELEAGGQTPEHFEYGADTTAFSVPPDAPLAPKEDGTKLKANGRVVAVSRGGQWVQP